MIIAKAGYMTWEEYHSEKTSRNRKQKQPQNEDKKSESVSDIVKRIENEYQKN